ncbi:hypothetical protein B0H34DRAFT_239648 [Crassisporium funariophilum]|nr:hypothetical protein B0H34DRAFT_239648 [Crassisporium funariophilum]
MKGCQARLVACLIIFFPSLVFAGLGSSARAISESKYTKAHSLGDSYGFDPRDGWQSVNVTNLQYKYRRQSASDLEEDATHDNPQLVERAKQTKSKDSHELKGLGGAVGKVIASVFKGLKGWGAPQPVIITWYTGHDLKNPSCWANGKWAPTDKSFAAALTMEGWKNRPECFKFLELCHTHKKCVFVRVVDTCAGCQKGSSHVDLTRAAFRQLAPYDIGTLTVNMRRATEPDGWFEDLWGPKVTGN